MVAPSLALYSLSRSREGSIIYVALWKVGTQDYNAVSTFIRIQFYLNYETKPTLM